MITPRNARGRPPGLPVSHPRNAESRRPANATPPAQEPTDGCIVTDEGDSDAQQRDAEPCPFGGGDFTVMLRHLVAERRDAWHDGVLEGFWRGWEQRGKYEAERGAA